MPERRRFLRLQGKNGRMHANKQGFFKAIFSNEKPIDLDLGCLYEMKDGKKGCIQALGKHFGSMEKYPYILLDGDDRTGNIATGENLRINGNQISQFKRILVYTFIYDGIANWKRADGIVTIKRNIQYSKDKGGVYECTPKGGKSRSVDIGEETIAILKRWAAEQASSRLSKWVFTQEGEDAPMFPHSPTRYFKKFGERYDIPGFHPHLLRHTSATLSLTFRIQ